jgi:hypothetical protein
MIEILALLSYIGVYYFLYKYVIDMIEFTCINYDEFLDSENSVPKVLPQSPKYEDKYKSELAAIPGEVVINPSDVTIRADVLLKESITEITDKINQELQAYESELVSKSGHKEQRTYFINDKMEQMKTELWSRILDKDSITKLAKSQLIQERLSGLKYSFVMEHTPVGNVVMYYNSVNEAFEYYSDNVAPYRYLDVVCRKYTIMNLCAPLYVDINEELKEFQKRAEECKTRDKEKEKEKEKEVNESIKKPNVFAKLKNYKQQPINTPVVNIPVKARTNKFLYQGRMNNFNFMKQSEQKPVLSYAEYKQRLMNK